MTSTRLTISIHYFSQRTQCIVETNPPNKTSVLNPWNRHLQSVKKKSFLRLTFDLQAGTCSCTKGSKPGNSSWCAMKMSASLLRQSGSLLMMCASKYTNTRENRIREDKSNHVTKGNCLKCMTLWKYCRYMCSKMSHDLPERKYYSLVSIRG